MPRLAVLMLTLLCTIAALAQFSPYASREEALKGIVKVVRQTLKEMSAAGEQAPMPLSDRHYSGVFKVRVPSIVHRNLVIEAAEAGVSLNRLVSAKLAHG